MAVAVVFDFGYTLVDEDRVWRQTAARLGCPESVFFAALGAVIERRGHHGDVFRLLGVNGRPDPIPFEPEDFYDDAAPCIRALKEQGHAVGIAGNFSVEIEEFLGENVEADFIASSERWGVEKPSQEFFARVVSEAGCAPADISYVGDRVDNDVVPSATAGMAAHFLVRGPWAFIQKDWPEADRASVRLNDLASLAAA
ncbi:MAG TPA: HAD family hydrolase [Gaiellaceae bacterium]|nr:HAD family hydrolase [Gaiellaceae bacterium]